MLKVLKSNREEPVSESGLGKLSKDRIQGPAAPARRSAIIKSSTFVPVVQRDTTTSVGDGSIEVVTLDPQALGKRGGGDAIPTVGSYL